jgi:light-regulated signal transduction histidine kinase (bacteriophytochrome)
VSHDLRAPLRAINGYSKLLQQNHVRNLNDEGLRYLQTIGNASERMARLIDDLLEFSRLGRQSLTVTDIDMRLLVANALNDVLDQRGAPRPTIEVGELLPTRGDRVMLLRVWMNLLDNAVKYSAGSKQAKIVIASQRHDAEVHYCVTDNGIGFDMNYYGQLFGVFQRLHSAGEFPGTGVGLAVVQRILARHGGRAWAHGTPGQGATFFFALPAGDAHSAAQAALS